MKKWPCIEYNCSWCCDPIKVHPWTKIPKSKTWEDLRQLLDEIRIPKKHPDTVKLLTYKCSLYNALKKLCDDYENRPEICKNTSCINIGSNIDEEEQYKNTILEEFYKVKQKWNKSSD